MLEMGRVGHASVEREGAGTGVGGEQRHHAAGVRQLLLARAEGRVDDRHLRGVDREDPNEPVPPSTRRKSGEAVEVAKGPDLVARLGLCGRRDGVLQIEDQRVRAESQHLFHPIGTGRQTSFWLIGSR